METVKTSGKYLFLLSTALQQNTDKYLCSRQWNEIELTSYKIYAQVVEEKKSKRKST